MLPFSTSFMKFSCWSEYPVADAYLVNQCIWKLHFWSFSTTLDW